MKFSALLDRGNLIKISGAFATEVFRRMGSDAPEFGPLGNGGAALATGPGRACVQQISDEHASHTDGPLLFVENTYGLSPETLNGAAANGLPGAETRGLELLTKAEDIALKSLEHVGRVDDDSTILVRSTRSENTYHGEDTPKNVAESYMANTLAFVRYGCADVQLFEATPSWWSMLGQARAFTRAHEPQELESDVVRYLGGDITNIPARGLDPRTGRLRGVTQQKEYIISLCLEEDGTVQTGRSNGKYESMPLEEALDRFYEAAAQENLILPTTLGLNCNALSVTLEAFTNLPHDKRSWVKCVYPNAGPERNPKNYRDAMEISSIPHKDFVRGLEQLRAAGALILGGCCGAEPRIMKHDYGVPKPFVAAV